MEAKRRVLGNLPLPQAFLDIIEREEEQKRFMKQHQLELEERRRGEGLITIEFVGFEKYRVLSKQFTPILIPRQCNLIHVGYREGFTGYWFNGSFYHRDIQSEIEAGKTLDYGIQVSNDEDPIYIEVQMATGKLRGISL